MAVRPFLYLGDTVCKCVLTTVQLKPRLHTAEVYKQVRSHGRFRSKAKVPETSFPSNYVEKGPVRFSRMWKPFAFTIMVGDDQNTCLYPFVKKVNAVGSYGTLAIQSLTHKAIEFSYFSGTTFVGAAIWEYERIRERTYRLINHYKHWGIRRTGWRHEIGSWWKNLTEGEKIFVPICFLNVIVFLSWRIPSFHKVMAQYFCANPAARAVCWPMLLSTFSHYSFIHLVANMYVLHSFCSLAVAALGKEQFVALYLTSGVVSSFVSHMYKTAFGFQSPSLGASGAVMGILGFVCTQFPDTYLTIIFLPMYKFTAGMGIKAIMGLDALGCLLRWQYFDHAAHLGGVLFGMFWQAWGNANLWQKREPVLAFWHEIRGPPKSQ